MLGLPKAPVPGFLGSSREGRPAPALSAWSWSRRLRAGLAKPERDAGSIMVLWKVLGARPGGPSEGRSCPERGFRGQPGFCHSPTVRKERDRTQKPEPGGGVLAPQWRQGERAKPSSLGSDPEGSGWRRIRGSSLSPHICLRAVTLAASQLL